MIKKVFALYMAALMAIGVFAGSNVFASEPGGVCEDGLVWSIADGILKISGNGDMQDYNLKKAPWYDYSSEIDEIVIADGVTSIGACAFSEPIDISGGGIEEGGEIGLSSVCDGAKRLTVADSVLKIGELAFYNCESLSEINMSANVKSIGKWAFRNCVSLTDVYYDNLMSSWNSISVGEKNFLLTSAKLHYVLYMGECGEAALWKLDSDGNLSIYGSGDMYDCAEGEAEWHAYAENVASVVIGEDITGIGEYAFEDIKVSEINIPYGVKKIGKGAFYGCDIAYMKVPSRFRTSKSEWLDSDITEIFYYALCEGVALNIGQKYMSAGETLELTAIFTPEDTTNKNVTWVSDNESVAEVKDAVVSAKENGSAQITVITEDGGFEASCRIDVITKATGIEIIKSDDVLYMKDTLSLTANVMPSNATNKKVSWKSSDESVLSVDENGLVTPHKNGSAFVYACVNETPDESSTVFTAQREITVQTRVESVSLSESEMSLLTNEQAALKETVYPLTATNKKVSRKSTDESVVKVDENGNITAVGEGSAQIIVTTEDGGFEAKCDIDVKNYCMSAQKSESDESVKIDISIKTLLNSNIKLIAAQYDSSKKMTDVKVFDYNENLSVSFNKAPGSVRIMLVSDLENIKPLAESIYFETK